MKALDYIFIINESMKLIFMIWNAMPHTKQGCESWQGNLGGLTEICQLTAPSDIDINKRRKRMYNQTVAF